MIFRVHWERKIVGSDEWEEENGVVNPMQNETNQFGFLPLVLKRFISVANSVGINKKGTFQLILNLFRRRRLITFNKNCVNINEVKSFSADAWIVHLIFIIVDNVFFDKLIKLVVVQNLATKLCIESFRFFITSFKLDFSKENVLSDRWTCMNVVHNNWCHWRRNFQELFLKINTFHCLQRCRAVLLQISCWSLLSSQFRPSTTQLCFSRQLWALRCESINRIDGYFDYRGSRGSSILPVSQWRQTPYHNCGKKKTLDSKNHENVLKSKKFSRIASFDRWPVSLLRFEYVTSFFIHNFLINNLLNIPSLTNPGCFILSQSHSSAREIEIIATKTKKAFITTQFDTNTDFFASKMSCFIALIMEDENELFGEGDLFSR